MSKKKKSKKDKSRTKTNKNKYFQIFIVALFLCIAAFFIYNNFLTESDEGNENTVLQNKSALTFTKEGELTFITKDGKFISQIDIEIAEDDQSRGQGLMYRYKMAETQGMLFIFPSETRQSFWMRNTPLSLDMIFVNKNNEIVTIHKNTEPFKEISYPSTAPAIYVIEVNAGYTDKHGIDEGDKITWRRI